MGNSIDTTMQTCNSLATVCDKQSLDRRAVDNVSQNTSLSVRKEVVGAAFMTAIAAFNAAGCCRKEKECSGRHFDCSKASLTEPGVQDYATEYDQPSTPASTENSSAFERDAERSLSFLGNDVAKGASLLIAPWIIIAVITKGSNGKLSEKFFESALLALWGTAFLLIADDANQWMVPVILTAFVSAGAVFTGHKKKIMALSHIAAVIYMLVSMSGSSKF